MGNIIRHSNAQYFLTGKSKLSIALETAFPLYYIQDVVINDSDVEYVTKSWNLVMNCEEIEEFLKAKKELNFEYSSCLTWFFDLFYGQFFVLCPDARPMFVHVSMAAQGRLLAGVISTALGLIKKPDKLRKRLIAVVDSHNPKNIYSSYYGIMGEALLWALKRVLGVRFDEDTSRAWVRVYSILLSIMIPRAVAYETQHNSYHASFKRNSSFTSTSTSNKSISNMKYVIETRIRNSVTLRRMHGAEPRVNASDVTPECPFKMVDNVEISHHNNNLNNRGLCNGVSDKITNTPEDTSETKYENNGTAICPFKSSNNAILDTEANKKHVKLNSNILKKASSAFGRLAFYSTMHEKHAVPTDSVDCANFSSLEDHLMLNEDSPRDHPHHHSHPHIHDNKIIPTLLNDSTKGIPTNMHSPNVDKKVRYSKSLDSDPISPTNSRGTIRYEVENNVKEIREECPYKFSTPVSSLFQPHHSTINNNHSITNNVKKYEVISSANNLSNLNSSTTNIDPAVNKNINTLINRDHHSTLVMTDPQSAEYSLPIILSHISNTKQMHLHPLTPLFGHPLNASEKRELSELEEEDEDF